MYARKIPLLQVIKYLPSSIELVNASALDVTASEGRQNLTIDMVLDKNSPGLESGGDTSAFDVNDPAEVELEDLFDRLSKNPTERKMLRDSYIPRGARQELVDYLKGKLAPTGQTINVSAQATQQASQAEASTEQAKEDAPQETEQKRGRGRPKGSTKTQQETIQEPDAQPETQAQPEQQAQEEKPAQEQKPHTKTLDLQF
jgi:hypothetical protein